MEQWYVGQKVVCVDATDTKCVKTGSVYTVMAVYGIYLDLDRLDNGGKGGMHARRFRPLDFLSATMDRLESEGAPVEVEISEPVLNRSN